MERTDYALAALDMDGTLLNSNHETTPYTRLVLDRAARAGKVIALCTGRCLSELWEHLHALPSIRYAICENGGCLYDVDAGGIIRQICIPDGESARILSLAAGYDVCVQCFFDSQSHMQLDNVDALRRYGIGDYASVFQMGSIFVGDMRAAWSGRDMEKINLYFASAADKEAFRRALGDVELHLADSLGTGYEISPKEATKARGLAELCAHLNVPIRQTVAVGDGANDLELMRAAGLSVAMGNACEEVRRVADAHTEDCDHDGAARAVGRYLLGDASSL